MSNVHVMLMENTAQLRDSNNLTHLFDLKGSLVDRMTSGVTKPSSTLKDQNFMACSEKKARSNQQFLEFQNSDRYRIISSIKKDVEFLKTQGLMDYSLFVVIERKDTRSSLAFDLDIQTREIFFGDQFDLAAKHQFTNLTKILHISLIDYL